MHWKTCWCWERLKAGREAHDRVWGGWMASPTRWTWVWVSSGDCWWTGKPGVLQSMGSRIVGHNWVTELNWSLLCSPHHSCNLIAVLGGVCVCVCVCLQHHAACGVFVPYVCVLSHVWLFVTPWTVALQAPLSIGFPTQEWWSGLPFPPPGHLPVSGTEPQVSCISCIGRRVWCISSPQTVSSEEGGGVSVFAHHCKPAPYKAWIVQ